MGENSDRSLYDNLNLRHDWWEGRNHIRSFSSPQQVPDGVAKWLDDPAPINETRRVKVLTCFDIVICTRMPDNKPAVLLSLRGKNGAFGGKWWMYGGSLSAYADIEESIAEVSRKECGISARPEALIGFYYTSAPDRIQSTMQPCYATRLSYDLVTSKMQASADHEKPRLFTGEELDRIPHEERHWYPMRVAAMVLDAMP